ncbi:hypothetical protein R3W88_024456 [Solanum pinnatisectum]|uniref:Replication protein A 70 kDa DNA-binding subunit B/D first OB fold domain-containing protein n=1 Tax=Solanum pinnatisectum TaxID=50273 RepID=A0AAV9M088_9SOLN|nr:hypothetical protein R3W88_024456 [Solanum pinnatisectum]
MISLHMILIDEKGTLIHAVILKNQVNKFTNKLSEGSSTIIRNFKVEEITCEYRQVHSIFKITFLWITAIQKLQDDTVHILVHGFQFIQLDRLWVKSRKPHDIHILNDLKNNVVGGIWRSFLPILYPNESGPYIVIVPTTMIKEFRGEVTLTTTAEIKIFVNLKIDNITSLTLKFSTKSVQVKTIESANVSNIPIEQAMFDTIRYLLRECMVTLHVQITEIDNFFDWYYISCNFDNKKVESLNGVYRCKNVTNNVCHDPRVSPRLTKVYVPDEEMKLQHHINKDRNVKYFCFIMLEKEKVQDLPELKLQNAGGSNPHYSKGCAAEVGEASIFNRRVSARRLKKRKKFFIDDDEDSNRDTKMGK